MTEILRISLIITNNSFQWICQWEFFSQSCLTSISGIKKLEFWFLVLIMQERLQFSVFFAVYCIIHIDRMQLNEIVSTVPTLGFNIETVKYKNLTFQMWDLGGQTSIRPYWRCYFPNTSIASSFGFNCRCCYFCCR